MRLFAILCITSVLWGAALPAQKTVTLTNPYAYIGQDNNVYVTDGKTTAALTNDSNIDTPEQRTYYDQPRWSPDGTYLVFMRQTAQGTASMMLAQSGQPPRELVGSDDNVQFASSVVAWSPDGKQVAFIGNDGKQYGIMLVSIPDGKVQSVTEFMGGAIGEAGADDPAKALVAREHGNSAYREQYQLSWTQVGILAAENSGSGAVLVTPQGKRLWTHKFGSQVPFYSDKLVIVTSGAAGPSSTLVALTDAFRDSETMFEIPQVEAHPVAWIDGALLYTTRTGVTSVTGSNPAGIKVFAEAWGFDAETATLTLWQYTPSGKDTVVFKAEGFDFGVVRPTAGKRLLISVITSNFDAVTALNRATPPERVRGLLAHPVTYVLEDGKQVQQIVGGQLDYMVGTFTVISPG